ncbi:hypothetical protein A2U01_0053596, partial [Trifolium medium]|nr:hypothetical protein [Trifolium medium]
MGRDVLKWSELEQQVIGTVKREVVGSSVGYGSVVEI